MWYIMSSSLVKPKIDSGLKYAVLKSKSKVWFVQNQNNVSEWVDLSSCGQVVQ